MWAEGAAEYVEYAPPGQMSGEMGLFNKEPKKYTLVAVQDSVIWRIDTAALERMMQEDTYLYIVLQRVALRYASHRLHHLMLLGQIHSV